MLNKRSLMHIGIGALGGLILLPMMNDKFRKKANRIGRDAIFRISDYVQDLAEAKK